MSSPEQLRMMTKVAHLYHNLGMVQSDIASVLGLSQARVSRLLSAAADERIIRTVVSPPQGLYLELETQIEKAFGLDRVHLLNVTGESPQQRANSFGLTVSTVFQFLPLSGKSIGLDSGSTYVPSFIDDLTANVRTDATYVVELFGGIGSPQEQHDASSNTSQLAELLHAKPLYLRHPAFMPEEIRNHFVSVDPFTVETLQAHENLDLVILDLNSYMNMNILDSADSRLGITVEQLKRVPLRIGIYSGLESKNSALDALSGGYANVLITDLETANFLV